MSTATDWFDVSFDEAEGKTRLSFDGDTYVRLLSLREAIAMVAELERALKDAGLHRD